MNCFKVIIEEENGTKIDNNIFSYERDKINEIPKKKSHNFQNCQQLIRFLTSGYRTKEKEADYIFTSLGKDGTCEIGNDNYLAYLLARCLSTWKSVELRRVFIGYDYNVGDLKYIKNDHISKIKSFINKSLFIPSVALRQLGQNSKIANVNPEDDTIEIYTNQTDTGVYFLTFPSSTWPSFLELSKYPIIKNIKSICCFVNGNHYVTFLKLNDCVLFFNDNTITKYHTTDLVVAYKMVYTNDEIKIETYNAILSGSSDSNHVSVDNFVIDFSDDIIPKNTLNCTIQKKALYKINPDDFTENINLGHNYLWASTKNKRCASFYP